MTNAVLTANSTFFATRKISASAILNWVAERADVAHQRKALGKLTVSALEDIGLTEAQVQREAHKPFWA